MTLARIHSVIAVLAATFLLALAIRLDMQSLVHGGAEPGAA